MGAIDPHGAASFGPKGHGPQDLCKQPLDIAMSRNTIRVSNSLDPDQTRQKA